MDISEQPPETVRACRLPAIATGAANFPSRRPAWTPLPPAGSARPSSFSPAPPGPPGSPVLGGRPRLRGPRSCCEACGPAPLSGTACEREAAGRAIRTPGGLAEAGLTNSRGGFDPCLLLPDGHPTPCPRRGSGPSEQAVPGSWRGNATLAGTGGPGLLPSEPLKELGPQSEGTCPEGGGGRRRL